jgi:hypothetical protein
MQRHIGEGKIASGGVRLRRYLQLSRQLHTDDEWLTCDIFGTLYHGEQDERELLCIDCGVEG